MFILPVFDLFPQRANPQEQQPRQQLAEQPVASHTALSPK
jgi:hypothetical protein